MWRPCQVAKKRHASPTQPSDDHLLSICAGIHNDHCSTIVQAELPECTAHLCLLCVFCGVVVCFLQRSDIAFFFQMACWSSSTVLTRQMEVQVKEIPDTTMRHKENTRCATTSDLPPRCVVKPTSQETHTQPYTSNTAGTCSHQPAKREGTVARTSQIMARRKKLCHLHVQRNDVEHERSLVSDTRPSDRPKRSSNTLPKNAKPHTHQHQESLLAPTFLGRHSSWDNRDVKLSLVDHLLQRFLCFP